MILLPTGNHGTRARYTQGCRCRPCKDSNRERYRRLQAEGIALAMDLQPPPITPAVRVFVRNGIVERRAYSRGCPGVKGKPCPIGAYLRKDSKGGVCRRCRELLVWDGLVGTSRVVKHVRGLSRKGVGYKSVADAASFSHTSLAKILAGKRRHIRARAEARILAVDRHAMADGARIPAGPTWHLLDDLLAEGFTRGRLARELGSTARTPALQIQRRMVLARTAARVEKLWRYYIQGPA